MKFGAEPKKIAVLGGLTVAAAFLDVALPPTLVHNTRGEVVGEVSLQIGRS